MTETMHAVLKEVAAPGAVYTEVPRPTPGPGEVLLRVKAASICGTDAHVYAWDAWAAGRVHPPRIMGHECAGEVVALGQGVRAVAVGDLVSVETHVTCGTCALCRTGQAHVCREVRILGVDRDGAFADYLVIPERNALVNPRDMDPVFAALLEPLGNAVHTVFAGEVTGCKVAVVGAGPIGLMAVGVAQAAGAELVAAVDIHAGRLAIARQMGADFLVDASSTGITEALLEVAPEGFDVVLEMSGSADALRGALRAARNGARVSLLGIPAGPVTLDLAEDVIMRGITLQGITGRRMFDTWYKSRALVVSGKLDLSPIVSARLPLARVDEAMELLHSGRAAKIALIPGDD